MQQLAQSWWVFDVSKSAFYLGLDAFLGQLPIILFSLVGGVIADRMDRRRLLLASQYVQMASAFLLTVLIANGLKQVWPVLVLSFVVGTAQAFGGPAYSALVPSLVDKEALRQRDRPQLHPVQSGARHWPHSGRTGSHQLGRGVVLRAEWTLVRCGGVLALEAED